MRKLLFAVPMLVPFAAHAHGVSPYKTLSNPTYTCVAGDNSAAINGLLSNGGVVQIAAGKCHLSSGLVMTVSGTTLTGAGIGQTIIEASQPNTIVVLTVGNAAVNWRGSGFTISNLTLSGALTTTAPTNPTTGQDLVVQGGVYGDGVTPGSGLVISNVETHAGVDGVTIHGSDVLATGLNTHNNRHSGFFVMGLATMPEPYDEASDIVLKASSAQDNNLDNSVNQTWDDIDISKYTANVTVGGPNAGDGVAVENGDILMGCPPTDSKCTSTPIGPFLIQGNTIDNTTITVQGVCIRTYGNVANATIDSNTCATAHNGIGFFGNTANSAMTNNTVSGNTAQGIVVQPLTGGFIGDSLTVSNNNVTMSDVNKSAIDIEQATNVTAKGNAAAGQTCSAAYTWNGGGGFSESGNTASGNGCP